MESLLCQFGQYLDDLIRVEDIQSGRMLQVMRQTELVLDKIQQEYGYQVYQLMTTCYEQILISVETRGGRYGKDLDTNRRD